MSLQAILAVSKNGVIGNNGQLPWYLSKDLSMFKKLTMGKTLIMGSKTYESLPEDKLPNRKKIVLSSKDHASTKDTTFIKTIDELRRFEYKSQPILIGGANLFNQLLPFIDRIYLTYIHKEYEGDTKIDLSFLESENFCTIRDENSILSQDDIEFEFLQISKVRRVENENININVRN